MASWPGAIIAAPRPSAARLQHRSELLDPAHADPDLAEEMIRGQLGYVRPDELIIPLDDSTEARPVAQRR